MLLLVFLIIMGIGLLDDVVVYGVVFGLFGCFLC